MSGTIIDFAKVTQMLDNGWNVTLFKNQMGSYSACGEHGNLSVWQRSKDRVLAQTIEANKCDGGFDEETLREMNDLDFDTLYNINTDDFTPEQALTRLSYKVHGEILMSPETSQ